MRVIGADAIPYQELPEAADRHLPPDPVCGYWLAIVNRLEHFILFQRVQLGETSSRHRARRFLNRLNTEAVGFAVRRHVFETVAVDAALKESFIDVIQDGNLTLRQTIILRQDAVHYRLYGRKLLGSEEANRRHTIEPVFDHLAGCRIPEGFLTHDLVARVITRLLLRSQRRTCLCIANPVFCLTFCICHDFLSATNSQVSLRRHRQKTAAGRKWEDRTGCYKASA